jgi:hypothetical protein
MDGDIPLANSDRRRQLLELLLAAWLFAEIVYRRDLDLALMLRVC